MPIADVRMIDSGAIGNKKLYTYTHAFCDLTADYESKQIQILFL